MALFTLLRASGGRVNEAALIRRLRCRLNSQVVPWICHLLTGGVGVSLVSR
jgi:hypothetical protein